MASPELVQKFKTLQRNDSQVSLQWGKYCDESGEGHRDPAWYEDWFIQDFIDWWETGEGRVETWSCPDCGFDVFHFHQTCPKCWPRHNNKGKKGGKKGHSKGEKGKGKGKGKSAKAEPAAVSTPGSAIFALCKLCPSFKATWIAYCKLYGEGFTNPREYEDEFICEFAENVAKSMKASLGDDEEKEEEQAAGEPRKRKASGEASSAPPAKNVKGSATAEAPAQKKPTMKKAVLEEIKRMNAEGGLLAPISAGVVAAALGGAGLEGSLDILARLEEQQADIEDPNGFILDEAAALMSSAE